MAQGSALRLVFLCAVAIALSADAEAQDGTGEQHIHLAKQSLEMVGKQAREGASSVGSRKLLSRSSELEPAKAKGDGDPAKERTEKCLAKLDDAQEANAKASLSQSEADRMADVGQPITNTHWGKKCLTHTNDHINVQPCNGKDNQKFMYNSLAGGTITSKDSLRCIEQISGVVKMKACNGNAQQMWKKMCGALVNGDAAKARMITRKSNGELAAAQWEGKPEQIWGFKEVVKHSKCDTKRYKVLDFDGSTTAAVHLRNFVGMPSKTITVSMWLKGSKGTPISYASKHKVKSFVLRNLDSLEVFIRDQKVSTNVDFSTGEWVHLAVSWASETGLIRVFKNGVAKFTGTVGKGEQITAGGCLMIGQLQGEQCGKLMAADSFQGQISNVQVFSEAYSAGEVRTLMSQPVARGVVDECMKLTGPDAKKSMRLGVLSRQFGSQELNKPVPPVCDLDQYKVKKITGPAGMMPHRFTGSGDVHYNNFAGCKYDDQSVGEWTLVKVDKANWEAAPLMIQYRTSPQRANCPWCMNGAVSYIDGCAVKFHGDQASAGFGGYSDPYDAYAAVSGHDKTTGKMNTQRLTNWGSWKQYKHMKVRGSNHHFEAYLTDGTTISCHRGGSINVNLPRKYQGKIGGLAGAGLGGKSDWKCGPNKAACPECTEGKALAKMHNVCSGGYVYGDPNHNFNGNRLSKPLVKWFKSWQVDGDKIDSVFHYKPGKDSRTGTTTGPGSFNRITGEKIKPPKDTNKAPAGKKEEAAEACKDFRLSPKARVKCIFDFQLLGKKALVGTKQDRLAQRASAIKKATEKTVRDLSQYRNTLEWSGSPSWGCVGPFQKAQDVVSKSFNVAPPQQITPDQHKEKGAKCEAKMANAMQSLRDATIGQSIKTQDKKRCINVKAAFQKSGKHHAELEVHDCKGTTSEALVFNRLAGGTLHTRDKKLCLTRDPKNVGLDNINVYMQECGAGAEQRWAFKCGAWVNGKDKLGRMLTLKDNRVIGRAWHGKSDQLWEYKEVVKHSKCGNKRFKTLKFDGTSASSVIMRNFIGMPSYKITVAAWIKGEAGTIFSYSSKYKLDSYTVRNPENLEIVIRNHVVKTGISFLGEDIDEWVHLAATWNSKTGKISVFKNGVRVFRKIGFAKGDRITAGGCLIVGQSQKTFCKEVMPGQSFRGEVTDLQMWGEDLRASDLRKLMKDPVPVDVIAKAGMADAPEPPKKLRIAFLSRQYASQEFGLPNPPVCDLDKFKVKIVKKLTGPGGHMRWSGSGDVHYSTFAGCKYDDQSVGEWVAVKVNKDFWEAAPLMIQFRTSPQFTTCHWCQNGAVSYIDGCAVKFHSDQASAGFGGYSQKYDAYAAFGKNGDPSTPISGWTQHKGKYITSVRANAGRFNAILSDGTNLQCQKYSIYLNLPRKYSGKIGGLAGTDYRRHQKYDFKNGPNTKACAQYGSSTTDCKEDSHVKRIKTCSGGYTYGNPAHVHNGNSNSKPLVRWFQSWQVDGNSIPSVFYYKSGVDSKSGKTIGVGSFNRKAKEKVKPPNKVNDSPTGKRKKAHDACKDFRENEKARVKCIFDYMLLGKVTIKRTKKDRMQQRVMNGKKANDRSVRDLSRYKNDAIWAAHRNWGCVGGFLGMQANLSTAKPVDNSKVNWIYNEAKNWDPKGAKPLFGADFGKKTSYSGTLKECQQKCKESENCLGITRYINDGRGGLCWGWDQGTATLPAGHMVSYTIDRDGSVAKAMSEDTGPEFDMEAINGTQVIINLPGTETLNLAEVAVFDDGGEELELEKISLSQQQPGNDANKCMDGNLDSFCATKSGEANPWLKADLGGHHRIAKVSLINRKGRGIKRINGAVVTVKSKGKVIFESAPLKGGKSGYDILLAPPLQPGSFVALSGGLHPQVWCGDGGSKGVKCLSSRITDWSKFKVADAGDGLVTLKGGKHTHKYYCGPDAKHMLVCNLKTPTGAMLRPIVVGKGIAFKTINGKFCKEVTGGIKCNSDKIDVDTSFSVKCLEECGATAKGDEGKLPLGVFVLKSPVYGRCVHPEGGGKIKDDTPLVFNTGCKGERLDFKLIAGNKGYYLQHLETGKCIQPLGGEADADGIKLVLADGCDFDRYLFDISPAGQGSFMLKNKEHERCTIPAGGRAERDGTALVFNEDCTSDGVKFLLEPKETAAAQYQTHLLAGTQKEWKVLGTNNAFGEVEVKSLARHINSKDKVGTCASWYGKYGGGGRRRRRMVFSPRDQQFVKAKKCDEKQGGLTKFTYNRMRGGLLHPADDLLKCVTRHGEKIDILKCDEDGKLGKNQKWKRMCGAWANGDKAEGRVLTLKGSAVTAEEWSGEKNQLWSFQEAVSHNKCGNKRFKLMKFDGSKGTGITLRNFIGIPAERITMTAWIKGTSGTLFSYGTKHTAAAFSVELHSFGIIVKVKGIQVKTTVKFSPEEWSHVAVSWDNRAGDIAVHKNGKHAFHKRGIAAKATITAGGCLVLGQKQKEYCKNFADKASYAGLMSDFQIWKGALQALAITEVMQKPVNTDVLEGAGKLTAPKPHKNLRLAYLSRQYASQELKEPSCDLDEFKKKKLTGPTGMMQWQGSGDVHYSNFAGCKYDDQSVGEWVAVKVNKKMWSAAPLMIQFRTSPQKTSCPWCQNGAVSYIDGCAVKFHDDQASAGFGGYSDRYNAYAAVNGKPSTSSWQKLKNMRVLARTNSFQAILTDGTNLRCQRYSIYLTLPRKYQGSIAGLAGTGQGANTDWALGPNSKACPECKEGASLPKMKGQCARQYTYSNPAHPFNGNSNTKPLVRWFQSWQVDGDSIPSVFYYKPGEHQAGSFNRKTGEPVKGTSKQASMKKIAAQKACKDFRESPKMMQKCTFDFMILGKVALKDSKKDRMNQRKATLKKPTDRSIRDMSRYKNDGEWNGHVSWGCGVDKFLKMQGNAVERFSSTKKKSKEELAKLHLNAPMMVPQAQWIETVKSYGLPMDLEVDIKATVPGSIFVSLFNKPGKKDTGLTLETGAAGKTAKIWQTPAITTSFPFTQNDEWHHVRITVNTDGDVAYYLNGKVIQKSKTKLTKGKVAFIGGEGTMLVKNVKVVTAASAVEKAKRKCLAKAKANPQDAGDVTKKPPCPAFTCQPSLCLCTCPGVECDTFPGVVGRG